VQAKSALIMSVSVTYEHTSDFAYEWTLGGNMKRT
jgi:hypothetical protein